MSLTHLHVGGLVAMGFDPTGRYLLTVSHSGRGIFDSTSWQRIARDDALVYPDDGKVQGIGPIAGTTIAVHEKDYTTGRFVIHDPTGKHELSYEEGMVTITSASI